MWIKVKGLVAKVQNWWCSYQFSGSPSSVLAKNLKPMKNDLRIQNKVKFSDVGGKGRISRGSLDDGQLRERVDSVRK